MVISLTKTPNNGIVNEGGRRGPYAFETTNFIKFVYLIREFSSINRKK